MTEGDPAVHAARALLAELLGSECELELAVVMHALCGIPLGDSVALDF